MTLEQPLVSVILPTFNRAALLPLAIQSILDQTYEKFELILVDDGSTDDTEQIVQSFSDSRIRYLHLENNVGSSAARNRGIEIAHGDLLAFEDSDDRWLPDKLAIQVRALEQSPATVGVCVCSYQHLKSGKTRRVVHSEEKISGQDVIDHLLLGFSYGTQTLLIRKETFAVTGGFDESLPRRQDWELCLRLAAHTSFVFISDVLVDIFHTEDSITVDPFKFIDALEKIERRHADIFKNHRIGHSMQIYKAGKHLAYSGYYRRAFEFTLRSIRTNPLNWRAHILLLALLTRTVSIIKAIKE